MAFLEYNPTQTLYQFCTLDGFQKILSSKVIWCTDLEAANDPRELALGFDHFVEALKYVRQNEYKGRIGELLSRVLTDLLTVRAKQQAFCACFSPVPDSLPMWREYGDNCRGVSIGFRPTAIKSLPGRIQKVKYLNPDTPEEFRQLIRDLASTFDPDRSPDDVHYYALAASSLLAAATSLKHNSWEYEKEIRFVFMQARNNPGRIPVSRYDDGTQIFWEKPLTRERGSNTIQYMAFPFGLRKKQRCEFSRAIARIVVGPRCSAAAADMEVELRNNGFEDFEVLKSECQIR
jgi:hypothetical protein